MATDQEHELRLTTMKHPIAAERRRNLARYRCASRLLGSGFTGRFACLMHRKDLLASDLKTYYVLNTDPLVVYLGNIMQHTFEIAELFKNRSVHFIKNFYHTFEDPDRLAALKIEHQQFLSFYPQHTINYINATPNEQKMFEGAGVTPCHFINKNALIDERQYRIHPEVAKDFDAVHNGQLAPYKRHELAKQIQSLSLIVYRHNSIGRTEEVDEYAKLIQQKLKHAAWLNDDGKFIAPADISSYLNRARIGLCLSAEEGPMAACMEYFLSGLAVVSTRSLGGREVFFDDEYVRVVDDDPDAVACAVRELADANICPRTIREKTLQKMQIHRERFITLVNAVLKKAGGTPNFHETFQSIFVNKLRAAAPFPGAFLVHSSNGMPIELCRQMAAKANA